MWLITQQHKYAVVSQVFSSTQPLSCLFVHDQRDVALDQGEGEEADVAGVLAGGSRLLWPGKKVLTLNVVELVMQKSHSCNLTPSDALAVQLGLTHFHFHPLTSFCWLMVNML